MPLPFPQEDPREPGGEEGVGGGGDRRGEDRRGESGQGEGRGKEAEEGRAGPGEGGAMGRARRDWQKASSGSVPKCFV